MKKKSLFLTGFLILIGIFLSFPPLLLALTNEYCLSVCEQEYDECLDDNTIDPDECGSAMDECETSCAAEQTKSADGDFAGQQGETPCIAQCQNEYVSCQATAPEPSVCDQQLHDCEVGCGDAGYVDEGF
jgi:hypothetical protein